jgi:hypothetical protein
MLKILAAGIAATAWGCGGVALEGETQEIESVEPIDCSWRVVMANPGPAVPGSCFRAVAGEGSCVRVPDDDHCRPSTIVNFGESYEVWAWGCEDWGAPYLESCTVGAPS